MAEDGAVAVDLNPDEDNESMSEKEADEGHLMDLWSGRKSVFNGDNSMFVRVKSDLLLSSGSSYNGVKFVGKYLMGDTLGEGSYGKVKDCLHSETLRRHAVKIVKYMRLRTIPNGDVNVRREIMILKRISHRNIILLFEALLNIDKKVLYIVMEYCHGGLKELLEIAPAKRLPVFQAHNYFCQLVDGLEYLHSCNIIHKDIKPDNLLLTADQILKIIDFGVAEVVNTFAPDDTSSISQGSPAFQPPEIANGDVDTFKGFKVDIWSAGVTLYKMTTGCFPFDGENIYQLFENISKGEYTIPDHVDALLANLFRGLLQNDPQLRLSIRRIRRDDWFRCEHPWVTSEFVTLPSRGNNDEDCLRRLTVIPYLENIYRPCSTPSCQALPFEVVYDVANGSYSLLHVPV